MIGKGEPAVVRMHALEMTRLLRGRGRSNPVLRLCAAWSRSGLKGSDETPSDALDA
jgi:hypothetical protein